MAKAAKKVDAKEEAPAQELVVVNKKAMSRDVGPAVIKAYHNLTGEETEAKNVLKGVEAKRYDILSQLTLAIVKAAENDDELDLTAYFSGDTKLVNKANDRIGIALGFRDAIMVGEGDKQKQKIVYSESVRNYFPSKDDPADVKQAKKTFSSNFVHQIKKCAQASIAIIEKNITLKTDKKTGTLMVSGPAIKKEFGQDSVMLNEKQTVEGKKGEAVKLKVKPSFTALATMGARESGVELKKAATHRGTSQTVLTPTAILQEAAKTIERAVKQIDTPDDKQIAALDKILSAVNGVLGYEISKPQ